MLWYEEQSEYFHRLLHCIVQIMMRMRRVIVSEIATTEQVQTILSIIVNIGK